MPPKPKPRPQFQTRPKYYPPAKFSLLDPSMWDNLMVGPHTPRRDNPSSGDSVSGMTKKDIADRDASVDVPHSPNGLDRTGDFVPQKRAGDWIRKFQPMRGGEFVRTPEPKNTMFNPHYAMKELPPENRAELVAALEKVLFGRF